MAFKWLGHLWSLFAGKRPMDGLAADARTIASSRTWNATPDD